MENPRYCVITKEITYIDGVPRAPGNEFESIAWQDPRLVEPLNEPARLVLAYRKRHWPDQRRPRSLFDNRIDRVFLPCLNPLPLTATERPPNAPMYVSSRGETFANGVTIDADVQFAFLGWPSPSWRAANVPAEAVLQYLGEHGTDPRLAPAPWDELSETIVLIDLPPPYKVDQGADPQPFAAPPFAGHVVRDGRLVPS